MGCESLHKLPPSGKKIGFKLQEDEDFTIPYVTDTIPNSPTVHQLPIQAKKIVLIIEINGEETITSQGALDEINYYQTPCGKFKVSIRL